MNFYNGLISKTNWTAVTLVLYNFFTAIVPVFPNVAWISTIVNLLGVILVVVFHQQGVQKAAAASAAASASAGKPTLVSGQ